MGFSSVTSSFVHLAPMCCADNMSICIGRCIRFIVKVQQKGMQNESIKDHQWTFFSLII